MSRHTLFQGLLLNLSGKIPPEQQREYLTKEQAYQMLKEHTQQDFGYDLQAWGKWISKNTDGFRVIKKD